jgi:hypothetical protein
MLKARSEVAPMSVDEGVLVEELSGLQTKCTENSTSISCHGILFDNHDHPRIEVTLNGHRVVGGGYTGDLQCTGLTHWCESLTCY